MGKYLPLDPLIDESNQLISVFATSTIIRVFDSTTGDGPSNPAMMGPPQKSGILSTIGRNESDTNSHLYRGKIL